MKHFIYHFTVSPELSEAKPEGALKGIARLQLFFNYGHISYHFRQSEMSMHAISLTRARGL